MTQQSNQALTVVVQCLANSVRDIDNCCDLVSHFDGTFKTRIMEIHEHINPDVLIMTEYNRMLSEDQKEDLVLMMDNLGYKQAGSFMRNDGGMMAFETVMWFKSDSGWELVDIKTPAFSHSPPNEYRSYQLRNGAVIASFSCKETGKLTKIGAIHNSLLINPDHFWTRDIVISELTHMVKESISDNVQWFGDFNITDVLFNLGVEDAEIGELLSDMNFVYTDKPDFCCGNSDFLPIEIEERYDGNRIELHEDGKTSRQVTTLIQGAGENTTLKASYHPVTFQETTNMTHREVAEITKGLDFTQCCFDHMTSVYNVV